MLKPLNKMFQKKWLATRNLKVLKSQPFQTRSFWRSCEFFVLYFTNWILAVLDLAAKTNNALNNTLQRRNNNGAREAISSLPFTSHSAHRDKQLSERVFQNRGVCGQAFPSFPSPTPSLVLFARPIFGESRMRKLLLASRYFVQLIRERLLRRQAQGPLYLCYFSS